MAQLRVCAFYFPARSSRFPDFLDPCVVLLICQDAYFSVTVGHSAWGEVLPKLFGVGCSARTLKPVPFFQTKIFPILIQTFCEETISHIRSLKLVHGFNQNRFSRAYGSILEELQIANVDVEKVIPLKQNWLNAKPERKCTLYQTKNP